jgi:curved DNA-binding protein
MDYYSILGVSKTASSDELRSAYKKLSMQHHPDRTGGDDSKFKQINEAYTTLKDPQKRNEYDNPQPQYAQGFGPNGFGNPSDFQDLFSQFGFNFGNMQGRQVRNKDVKITYTIEFADLFTGKAVNIQYGLPSGRMGNLDAAIPPGVKSGDVVRFAGFGDDSIPHLEKGALLVHVRVIGHKEWSREGDNIVAVKNVSIFDLMIGTSIEIKTPVGNGYQLKIPKGTTPGTTFSIAGQGIPNSQTRRPGNVHIKIGAVVPKIQDEKIINQLKDIKDAIDTISK